MSDDITMRRYSEFQPTGMDPKGLGLPERQDWYVCSIAHNRDSSLLEESNWEVLIEELNEIDPNREDWEVHRFDHWGPGWFEIVLVRPDSACVKRCQEFSDCVQEYSVLSETHYSDKEYEAIANYWESKSLEGKVALCQETGANVFAARRSDVPEPVYEKIREIVNE